MAQMKMQGYIIKERQTVFIESILILMYCLRNDYNFGQKRGYGICKQIFR